jgi:hypothetical protein
MLASVVSATTVMTAIYFWMYERDTYRSSWRVHLSGITLPLVLMAVSSDPIVWSIATSFLIVHVASMVSERINEAERTT